MALRTNDESQPTSDSAAMKMTSDDLRRIEAAFNTTLPEAYQRLALSGQAPPQRAEWFATAEALIETNMVLLEEDWDVAFLAFAGNGAGDYYCLELDTPDVVFYSHVDRSFTELGTFEDWVATPADAEVNEIAPQWRVLGFLGILALIAFLLLLPIWFVLRFAH